MDNLGGNIASGLLISLVVILVVFLIFREVLCWYWKINQSIALLTEIRDLLAGKAVATTAGSAQQPPIAVAESSRGSASPPPAAAPAGPMGTCPNCSTSISLAAEECPKCKASFEVGSAWKVLPR